jgi:hypothetical protein
MRLGAPYYDDLPSAPFPKYWGFHPYGDIDKGVRRQRPLCPRQFGVTPGRSCPRRTATRMYRAIVRKTVADAEVWFTEAGSRIDNGLNTESSQADEVDYMMRWLTRGVHRIFYYHHWFAFEHDPAARQHEDEGLLDNGPHPTNDPRFGTDGRCQDAEDPNLRHDVNNRVRCAPRRPAYNVFKSFVAP